MDAAQKMKSYQLLIEMVNKTSSSMESESIIQFILDGIIDVFPCVDKGVLFLYEKETDLLRMVATHNIEFNESEPFLKKGEGVSGKCFVQQNCIALNSTKAFVEYMDTTSSFMRSFPEANMPYPFSAMACTLMVEDTAVGVVILYNYSDSNYTFSDDDLELLNAAADHAAITISKSQLIVQKDFYLKKLEESNRALESTVTIQTAFTDILLNYSSFPKILDYLKIVLQGEVCLYDVFLEEIYSTTQNAGINLTQIIHNHFSEIFNDNQSDRNIFYRLENKLLIIRKIMVQEKLIGFLLVSMHDRTINTKEEAILNHGALVIALEWMKNDAKTKSFSDYTNRLMDLIINEADENQLLLYANNLGLKNQYNYCMAIIHRGHNEPGLVREDEFDYLSMKNIIRIIKYSPIQGIVFSRNDELHMIFYSALAPEEMNTEIIAISQHVTQSEYSCFVKGAVYSGLKDLRRSYYNCLDCLNLKTQYGYTNRLIDYDKLGIWKLLIKLDRQFLEEYANEVFRGISDEQPSKKEEYLSTLIKYIGNNRNIKATSEVMNLHFNTIYFRLAKIEKLLGVDFNKAEDWMVVETATLICQACDKNKAD